MRENILDRKKGYRLCHFEFLEGIRAKRTLHNKRTMALGRTGREERERARVMKLKVYADRMSQPSRAIIIFCK